MDGGATVVAGSGAIGSRFAAHVDRAERVVFLDADRVTVENLGIAAFTERDLGLPKAEVLAERRRATGLSAGALDGELRYVLRPGLVRALDAAVLCLDNASAIRDAADAIWSDARPGIPVVVLGCGAADGGYQARLFRAGGSCPVCLMSDSERRAMGRHGTTGCSAVATAPRASLHAAEAAAVCGAAVLARFRAGEHDLADCRVQRDGAAGSEYRIRMPATPSPRCPVGPSVTREGSRCPRSRSAGSPR
jgi:molybdopterin/thiamine biosynthesis adenylyltransferase